jgi:hypothetical protein
MNIYLIKKEEQKMKKLFLLICFILIVNINCFHNEPPEVSYSVYIMTKNIGQATCPDSEEKAYWVQLEAHLKNYTNAPIDILSWRLDFYSDGIILAGFDKQNYLSIGCGETELQSDPFLEKYLSFKLEIIVPKTILKSFPMEVEITFFLKNENGSIITIGDRY